MKIYKEIQRNMKHCQQLSMSENLRLWLWPYSSVTRPQHSALHRWK